MTTYKVRDVAEGQALIRRRITLEECESLEALVLQFLLQRLPDGVALAHCIVSVELDISRPLGNGWSSQGPPLTLEEGQSRVS